MASYRTRDEDNSNNNGYLPLPKKFATKAIHGGQDPEKWECLSLIPPVVMSTTYKQLGPGTPKLYIYGRSGNPSRSTLEECLAAIEEAKYSLCFASGLGSITTIFGLFEAGDHILCGDDLYGGTIRLFNKVGRPLGLDVTFADATDPQEFGKFIKPNTKLIWIETPTNPLLKVVDIAAIAKLAKAHNIIFAVDNTFLTPYFQRPLTLGADLSVYSLTKYINGHSDVVMGAATVNDEALYEKLKFLQKAMGVVPSPSDCAMVTRSLKTLALRMKQHAASSLAVAKFLDGHPKIVKVLHPGLSSHPHHELAKKQTSGHSGMLSFYLKGGLEESKEFLSSLKVFTLAESLGGAESLAEIPSIMTHISVPKEERDKMGISDNLIRLSVGLEDTEDLLEDLEQALEKLI